MPATYVAEKRGAKGNYGCLKFYLKGWKNHRAASAREKLPKKNPPFGRKKRRGEHESSLTSPTPEQDGAAQGE